MINKKIFMFLFSVLILLAAVSAVDAALCRGFDGYYHDCGYNYGQNSYGSSYGKHSSYGYSGGSGSYGKQSYGYSGGNYRNQKIVYVNSYKKQNPINDYQKNNGPSHLALKVYPSGKRCDLSKALVFRIQRNLPHTSVCGFIDSSDYIYSGSGYQRTRKDVDVRYVDYNRDRYRDGRNVKVTYIRDERTYEHRSNVNPSGRQLKIYLVGDTGHASKSNYYSHNYSDDYVIKLGGGHSDNIWHDGDPYHDVKDHDHNVRTWKLEGEGHCPDGFACASGDYY